MIDIKNLVNKYIDEGYEEIYANAKVAQDIVLTYLFKSKYKNNVIKSKLNVNGNIVEILRINKIDYISLTD